MIDPEPDPKGVTSTGCVPSAESALPLDETSPSSGHSAVISQSDPASVFDAAQIWPGLDAEPAGASFKESSGTVSVADEGFDLGIGRHALLDGASPTSLSLERRGNEVFPHSVAEVIERVLYTREALRSGVLLDEAESLGVSPEWVQKLHSPPVRVGITEQLMPLPTLFAKLGTYGSPQALVAALHSMREIAAGLSRADSSMGMVSIGYQTSLDHDVVFKAITGGFYFLVPRPGAVEDKERIQGKHFFSNSEEKLFKGAGYRDLTLSVVKLDELGKQVAEYHRFVATQGRKSEEAMQRQEAFNESRLKNQQEVTAEMLGRVDERRQQGDLFNARAMAAAQFLDDMRSAVDHFAGLNGSRAARIEYCGFLERFNAAFARRLVPDIDFRTWYGEHINELPSFGITDWPRFLGKFEKAGLLRPGDAILRLRVEDSGKGPDYRVLALSGSADAKGSIRLVEKGSGHEHDLYELVAQSQARLLAGQGPSLIPIAIMRYWANYAMSSNVGLDDGMPYEKIKRVARAMRDPEFTISPRGLTIFPYTELTSFIPTDPSEPYDDLRPPLYDVLDYYQHASGLIL